MDVQNINLAPKYITDFISMNIDKINEIYNEGLQTNPEGILGCKCSEKENRMDIQFMNETMITEIIEKESWDGYKKTISQDKKLLYIHDIDLKSSILITI